jgi:3-hydroxy-9,10-secoandrosta-1,3,5(10)-triene-9,17-dione monooxygenase reductase component
MAPPPDDNRENPFLDPEDAREPARRLRGRLLAPVTIVTAGSADGRAGLTVSSVMIAEGRPPVLYFLLNAASDLFYALEETGRFIVHVCERRHRTIADVFAGLRPSPGGPFAGVDIEDTPFGPVIADLESRAHCAVREWREESYSALVSANIERVDLSSLDDPLAHFRGRYRGLD